jgi:hypothetical protein
MKQKSFHVATLGSRTNHCKSAVFTDMLKQMDWVYGSADKVGMCIVNANQKSLHGIKGNTYGPLLEKLDLTGLVVERKRESLGKIYSREIFVSNKDTENFLEVEILGVKVKNNEIKKMLIQGNTDTHLVGELI